MRINKEKLNLLNSIVKTEVEIERLERLVQRLKTEYSSDERKKVSYSIYKDSFNSEVKFLKYIKETENITEIHSDEEGVYILYDGPESESALQKRKKELAERIDKIISHNIPFNKKKLKTLESEYALLAGEVVE